MTETKLEKYKEEYFIYECCYSGDYQVIKRSKLYYEEQDELKEVNIDYEELRKAFLNDKEFLLERFDSIDDFDSCDLENEDPETISFYASYLDVEREDIYDRILGYYNGHNQFFSPIMREDVVEEREATSEIYAIFMKVDNSEYVDRRVMKDMLLFPDYFKVYECSHTLEGGCELKYYEYNDKYYADRIVTDEGLEDIEYPDLEEFKNFKVLEENAEDLIIMHNGDY